MIARIVVGSGSGRTSIDTPRDKDVRRTLANKLKGALFATNKAFHSAKARGERALAVAA